MIGENLKKFRREKGLSLRALAEKANISKSTLNDIENNNVKSSTINTLQKIADALEISLTELLDSHPITETKTKYKEWDETYNTNKLAEESRQFDIAENNAKKIASDLPIIPKEFTDASEARAYISKHQIFGFGGFNPDKMSDDEILEFSNELLRQMELVAYKYKK